MSELRWSIYVLKDPRTLEVRYVGWTKKTPESRLGHHISEARMKTQKSHVRRWLLSLPSKPVIEVIETGVGDGWDAAERKWIKHHRNIGTRLTNITDGGGGAPGRPRGVAERIAASERKKKYWASIPKEKRSILTLAWQRDLTHEQRSEIAKKRQAVLGPERRSEISRKGEAAMPFAKKSEKMKRAQASRSPEQRSQTARKREANISSEVKTNRASIGGKTLWAALTPEERTAKAKRTWANRTPEQRRECAAKRAKTFWGGMTPEQRAEFNKVRGQKIWTSRRMVAA